MMGVTLPLCFAPREQLISHRENPRAADGRSLNMEYARRHVC